jgi:hypothetical protein
MKKTKKILNKFFIPVLFFVLCANPLSAQKSLLGSWKVTKEFEKTVMPQNMTFDLFKDSMILIKPASDSLNFTTIISTDSGKATIKNSVLDAKSHRFLSYYGKVRLLEGGKKMIVEYIQEKTQQKKIVEYSLVMFCCSNHSPPDCTINSTDIPKMKTDGCTGIHSN